MVGTGAIGFLGRVLLLSGGFLWRKLFWEWWLGYGERPIRVLVLALLILVTTWILYWQLGTFVLDSGGGNAGQPTWQNALYYSLISFTALGYGGWVPQPVGWAQWVGVAESFLGIFSVVFFSIALTLRITR
jgi:hypothetical protein